MANQTDTDKTSINALPEYKIRTMKEDLAKAGPAKKSAPPEKLPIAPEDKPARAPLPSAEELISEKKLPKAPKPAPKPASKIEKPKVPILEKKKPKKFNLKPLIILAILVLVIIAISAFFYWQGTKPPQPSEEGAGQAEPQIEPEQPIPSASLIPVNETKIISLSPETSVFNLLKQEAEASQLINTFKRIAILKNEQEFLSLKELFQELVIPVPPYTLLELKQDYTLVLYSQNQGRRLGLITQVKNPGNLRTQLIVWEQTMVDNFKNFYIDDQPGEKETQIFQDDNYKETAIRYINLPNPYLTLNYAILNDLFIIGTSKEVIYTIIDKIKM